MASTRTVDVGPVGLAVLEAGTGGRPLLLVHGFTGAKEDFADHLDAFAADGFHVLAPDLRGHGASAKPTGESSYGFDVLAADLLALADASGWFRFDLLGHSMGGIVAQVLALQAPERLRSLVLLDTAHGPVAIDRALSGAGVQLVRDSGIHGLADLLAAYAAESPLETPAARRLRETRPGHVEENDRKLRAVAADMYTAMLPAMLDPRDRLDALASLPVPTLVVVGEQDGPFIPASERMAAAIPGARLEVIADAGHSPQQENPEAWAKVVTAFLLDTRPDDLDDEVTG